MRILFLCGRELNYTRNQVLLNALMRIAIVDVIGKKGSPGSIILRSIQAVLQSIPKLILTKYDLIFVGFFGHFIMLPVGLLARSPILFDAFVSAYDTMIDDRKIAKRESIIAGLAFWLDKISCNLADRILLDTDLHAKFFEKTFLLSNDKFGIVPVGCDETIFYPHTKNQTTGEVKILFYCTYLPLHGVEIVIKAAAKLKGSGIRFHLIGNGIEYNKMRQMANLLGANNISFFPPVTLVGLAEEISSATICLGGHFGISEKAARVIPGKVYQCIAMEKAVIVGDNPANRELLTHGWDAWFCEMGDSEALAKAIKTLADDNLLRKKLEKNARNTYLEKASTQVINHKVECLVNQLTRSNNRHR